MSGKKLKANLKRKTKAQLIEAALSKLTPKQRALVEGAIRRKSKTQNALDAGYKVDPESRQGRKNAHKIAATELAKPDVKEALKLLLEQHNLGLSRILEKIDEGLEATKTVAVLVLPAPKPGEKSKAGNELIEANEKTTDWVTLPDLKIRHQYLETALALHGLPDRKKGEGDGLEPYPERIKRIWLEIGPDAPIDTTATEVK